MRSSHGTECQEVQTILQEVQYLEHIVLPEVVTKDPKKMATTYWQTQAEVLPEIMHAL
jgi:hypothetical protein